MASRIRRPPEDPFLLQASVSRPNDAVQRDIGALRYLEKKSVAEKRGRVGRRRDPRRAASGGWRGPLAQWWG